ESAFAQRYGDTTPSRMTIPLHTGLTGTAAGERRVLRVNDTLEDSRYIKCDVGFDTRSELVVPLLLQDRLIGVLDLERADSKAISPPRAKFSANCFRPALVKSPASNLPLRTSRPASSAATFTIFFP